jgi:hypothetical protein
VQQTNEKKKDPYTCFVDYAGTEGVLLDLYPYVSAAYLKIDVNGGSRLGRSPAAAAGCGRGR